MVEAARFPCIHAKRERRSRSRAGLGAYCSVNRSADKGCIESNPIPRLPSEKGSPRRDNERAVSKYEGHKANLPNFCSAHSHDTPSWLGRESGTARPRIVTNFFKPGPRGRWQPEPSDKGCSALILAAILTAIRNVRDSMGLINNGKRVLLWLLGYF